MAVRGSRGAQQRARTEAERARLYAARTFWHQKQLRRRRRDNAIAGALGGLVVIGAVVSQTVLGFTAAPEPAPTPTSSSVPTTTPAPTPTLTGAPIESPTPAPTLTPDE